jgi:phosphoribosylglycinamide formyltransferase-1
VHFVDEGLDAGPIIVQRAVEVRDDDDAHSLSDRILEQEHIAYVDALKKLATGNYEITGRRVILKASS